MKKVEVEAEKIASAVVAEEAAKKDQDQEEASKVRRVIQELVEMKKIYLDPAVDPVKVVIGGKQLVLVVCLELLMMMETMKVVYQVPDFR